MLRWLRRLGLLASGLVFALATPAALVLLADHVYKIRRIADAAHPDLLPRLADDEVATASAIGCLAVLGLVGFVALFAAGGGRRPALATAAEGAARAEDGQSRREASSGRRAPVWATRASREPERMRPMVADRSLAARPPSRLDPAERGAATRR